MGENASIRNKMPLILFSILLGAVAFLTGGALITLDPFLRYARIVVITVLEVLPWLIVSALGGVALPELLRGRGWLGDFLTWHRTQDTGYQRGMPPASALYTGLAMVMPALNPIVWLSTALAFPNNREMLWGRLVGTVATALLTIISITLIVPRKKATTIFGPLASTGTDRSGDPDAPAGGFDPSGETGIPLSGYAVPVLAEVLRNLGPLLVAALAIALVRVIDGGPLVSVRESTAPWVPGVVTFGLFLTGYLLAVPAVGDAVVVRLLQPWIPAPLLVAFLVTGPTINIRRRGFHPVVTVLAACGSVATALLVWRRW